LVGIVRNDALKKNLASLEVMDVKSIKNTDTAKEKEYKGGTKVSEIKLHIAINTIGLPHAIHVTWASVTNRNGALEILIAQLGFPFLYKEIFA